MYYNYTSVLGATELHSKYGSLQCHHLPLTD